LQLSARHNEHTYHKFFKLTVDGKTLALASKKKLRNVVLQIERMYCTTTTITPPMLTGRLSLS